MKELNEAKKKAIKMVKDLDERMDELEKQIKESNSKSERFVMKIGHLQYLIGAIILVTFIWLAQKIK